MKQSRSIRRRSVATPAWIAGVAACALIAYPGETRASSVYPDEVAAHLGAPSVPPCSLCHVDGRTGAGTAETSFAQALRARGLTGGADLAALRDALDASEADGVDSDADGVIDVAELQEGTDPNVAGAAGAELEEAITPTFGCFASVVPGPPPAGPGSVLSVAMAALLVRSARRRAGRRRCVTNSPDHRPQGPQESA